MQVFEFYFNPKTSEDRIFNSFCHEPENIYERRLGSLYVVGELRNALPQNLRFLERIFQVIKGKYYTYYLKSPEIALRESLKAVNEFLAEEVKKENVSWLGNLSLAALSLKDFDLNFSKIEDIKILLLRTGKINDISKSLEFEEVEPYPLKVFGNIVSGKLAEDDLILVLTKEIFNFFSGQNLIDEIAEIIPFEEKRLKKVLKTKKGELLKTSGTCLLIVASKETEATKTLTFEKQPEKFSFSQAFSPVSKPIKNIISKGVNFLKKINFQKVKELVGRDARRFREAKRPVLGWRPKKVFPRITFRPKITLPRPSFKLPSIPQIKVPKLKIPKISLKISLRLIKNLILVLVLIFFLSMGFLIFRAERKENLKLAKEVLSKVESKITQAENFLIFKDELGANIILQEAWKEILPQTKSGTILREEAQLIKKSIEEKLVILNKLEKIADPEILFKVDLKEINLIPQKILAQNLNLYFFNSLSSNLYKLEIKENIKSLLEAKTSLKLGVVFQDSILFFSRNQKGNPILIQPFPQKELDNDFQEKSLQMPYDNFNFDILSSYKLNLYFLDKKTGEIIRYYNPLIKEVASPQLWLNPKTKKAISARSMAIDGSLWILTENNEIDCYSQGSYKETLKLEFWPYLKAPTKIWASPNLPYLYLLEPVQNRVIILTKSGKIVKQYQSEKFDNLLDFAVSPDGKTIYLLNGLKVYNLSI